MYSLGDILEFNSPLNVPDLERQVEDGWGVRARQLSKNKQMNVNVAKPRDGKSSQHLAIKS